MRPLKALILNASLKSSEEESNTEALAKKVCQIYDNENIVAEVVRLADYAISYGMSPDMGDGDEWPQVFEKVKEADILIIGTPLWLGEKSSIATLAIERLYGSSGETNDKGQAIYYNKVGGVVVTGNEDGAKHAAASILYGLSHIGFVIPPNVDTYWVGEAGPGPSYIAAGQTFHKKAC
ncbi:multimeric flavodoxin WrbA [Sporosarcina psychrophila]|uniref:Multimeric flavodoxin WrbA n=1 Tax=Sporosarcina psychrophila TaxID=1476 RepID=A0ABV2K8Y7_SPOPS